MARYGSFLYRRNGRYYARFRVPLRLQVIFGRSRRRASLHAADFDQARLRVLDTVLGWKRSFVAISKMLDGPPGACHVRRKAFQKAILTTALRTVA